MTTSRNWTRLTALTLAGSILGAVGHGFDLPDQDAFAIGRGLAYVATADNPSAIYFNPAGIAQIRGNSVRASVYGVSLMPTFEQSGGGQTFGNQEKLHAVPSLFYTYGPSEPEAIWTVGLGVFAPFGLGTEWQQDTGFRTVGIEGQVNTYCFNPTIAVRILPTLMVGAGISATYADLSLRQGLFWPAQPYDEFSVDANGWSVGYSLGVLWQPVEKWSFGASFRSANSYRLSGQTEAYNNVPVPSPPSPFPIPTFAYKSDAEADFDTPLKGKFGVSFRPTTNWNFEVNAEYTGWNVLKTVTIEQENGLPPLIPDDIPLAFNWESSWYYEFGATYYFEKGWYVSGGYLYNQNSVPDANYSPIVADLDRQFISCGIGYRGQRFDVDLAYQFGFANTRTVTGSAASPAGQTADGNYDFTSHAVALSVGWRF